MGRKAKILIIGIFVLFSFLTWWPATPWMHYSDSDFAYKWAKLSLYLYTIWVAFGFGLLIWMSRWTDGVWRNLLVVLGIIALCVGYTIGPLLHICSTGLDCV